MNKYFLATHGHMASGIQSSMEVLLGTVKNFTFYDAYVDGSSLTDTVDSFLNEAVESDTIFLLTDMYGGSVNNALIPYSNQENVFLISGVNLIFVLQLYLMQNEKIDRNRLLEIIDEAKNAFTIVEINAEEIKEEDIFD